MIRFLIRHRLLAALLALALALTALLLEGRYCLVVSEYTLVSARLPESFDGFRVVQLSDLHGAVFGRGNRRLLDKVRAARPDMIALTGDLVDGRTDLAVIDTLLAGLTEIAPVYFVSGNHEWDPSVDRERLLSLFERYGVDYLRNEYVLPERGGAHIALAGVEDPNSWRDMPSPEELAERIQKEQGDVFTLLLGHRNEWAEQYPALAVDLILCGHAHGGVVRLPGLGGLLGHGGTLFPAYAAGAFVSGRYTMIVSRGLGSGMRFPRLLNSPDIVAVTLWAQAS